jgi:hypothetical protein
MAKTNAERQKEYRERNALRNALRNENVTRVTKNVTECNGPLSVYSPTRWESLQQAGFVWYEEYGRAYRPAGSINGQAVIMGATVPGDPAYKGMAKAG